jgi:prepilin-type N-terminal cleavage/methylation domain-containing protein
VSHRARGFSLIEVLIALVAVGALTLLMYSRAGQARAGAESNRIDGLVQQYGQNVRGLFPPPNLLPATLNSQLWSAQMMPSGINSSGRFATYQGATAGSLLPVQLPGDPPGLYSGWMVYMSLGASPAMKRDVCRELIHRWHPRAVTMTVNSQVLVDTSTTTYDVRAVAEAQCETSTNTILSATFL